MRRFYCSYFDRNYLVRAIALIESLNRHEKNEFTFHAVCLDEITRLTLEKLALPNVVTVPIHEIEQRDFPLLATKPTRTQVEYYWTCTPTIILRLMQRNPEIDVMTYVDSDMCFFSSPDAIYSELASNSILLHEHRYCPELSHLAEQGGRFNVGLLQFRRDATGLEALDWWRERCIEWCYWRFEDGKMGDQRYLHDWPSRYPNVRVLENVGAGLAPWNHTQYEYSKDKAGSVLVNGAPLVFYHYQSLQIVEPRLIIPAGHTTYPLTTELVRDCFVPYANNLASAAAQARTIIPDFSFGISNADSLTAAHAFIAKKELSDQIAALNAPHQPVQLEGDWILYKSPQVIEGRCEGDSPVLGRDFVLGRDLKSRPINKTMLGQDLKSRPIETVLGPDLKSGPNEDSPNEDSPIESSGPIPNLWPEGRPVANEDDLLRELLGRPIAREIRTAYIVGAHRFQEKQLIDALFPNLERIYLFEPLPDLYAMLKNMEGQDPRIKVFGCALADRDGQAEFNVTNNDAASSSLMKLGKHKEIFPHVGVTQTITVECRTLDTIINEYKLAEPDMLFLDVQGAEYGILAAISRERLARTRLIYTEASKEEIYLGSRPLDDIIGLLEPEQKFVGFAPLVNGLWNHGNALFANANDVGLLDFHQTRHKVSAIVSTYNSEKFIRGCLDDLIAQTLYRKGGLEIVVVNTGSQQNEREIVEEYKQRFDHITHIWVPQRESVYAAWNRGIKAASGKYVTSANTDDRHRPDALERMAGALDSRPDIALVYADVDITTQENATFGGAPVKGKYQWLEFDRRTMFMACYMGPQPMWRRELHDRYGYFEPDFKSAGDYEFWLRMCPTDRFLHIPETLGLYLESPASIEHANQETAARETLVALDRHWPKEWGRRPEPGAQNAFAASQAKAQAQPDSGDIISQAMTIAARGDNRSARSLLWKAIEADPSRAQAYYNLAALLVKDGHVIDAADHACKAVEIDPTDPDAIEILTKVKTLLRATKPAPKAKAGKKAGKKGLSQADIDSKLRRINSLLSAAAPAKPKAASTGRKQTLSVCMIVRDEEAFIEDCLVSVRGLADEIVVVDTGSKDRTADIARSHGASFHSFKWNGSFSDARNYALEHATCDWVLCLDADERLDANSRPIIEQAMADSGVDAYDLTICSYLTDGPSPEVEISTRCSLFRRRPEYRFEGRVREQVGRAVVASGGRAGRCQAVIYHHGYRPDVKNNRQKHKKCVELLRKELEANPSDAYYLYHLGAELAAHGEHSEAVPSLAKAAELLPRGHNLAPLTFAKLAESVMVTGDPTEAMQAIERAEALGIRHPQLSFTRGNILRCLERWEEAVQAFEMAVALGKQGLWDGDPSVYSHKAEYGLAACYLALGDCDAAAEHARGALQARPDNKDAAYILAKARELAKVPAKKPAPARKTAPAPKAQPKISLCMIARDEEAFIAQCLDSAKDFVDEIIVVDTGSSDRTPEIAKSYGAKVYEFPWNDSYADARNESLKRASHEWILVLDADEKLDPATAHLLRREIANPRAEGYNILFRNVMTDGVTPDITSHRVCRLFRNDPKYRYESRVHEHVENAITRNGGRVGQLDVLVHHYGYRTDIVAERGKHERYVRMLEAEVRDNPDDIFYLHHFSAALCAGNEFDRAIPHLQHACDIVTVESAFAPMVFSHLVNALREMNRLEEALEVVERAGKIGIKYPQLSFCEANVLLSMNRPTEAIEAFEQAIAMGRGKDWTGDAGTVGYKADFGLASAYFMLGNHDRAIEYAESALAQKPGNVAALDLLARTYAITGNQPMQEKYLCELSAQLPGDPKPIIILGELYEKQGRPDEAARRFESLIDIGEETATLRVKLGNLAEARGLYDDAERQYLRAMEIDDSAPEIYNALGLLRAARSRYQEALDLFTKAIEIAPASANAYFNAGDVLYSAGDYAQAADFYQAGLERSPNHAPAFLRLGNCYFHAGVPQAAAIAYRQALAIDPGFADASNNLAMVEESLGAQAA